MACARPALPLLLLLLLLPPPPSLLLLLPLPPPPSLLLLLQYGLPLGTCVTHMQPAGGVDTRGQGFLHTPCNPYRRLKLCG